MAVTKEKEIPVCCYFIHKSGIVSVATTLFPPRSSKAKITKRLIELLDQGGTPKHWLDFRTNYAVVDDVVSVLVFTPTGSWQFSYNRSK